MCLDCESKESVSLHSSQLDSNPRFLYSLHCLTPLLSIFFNAFIYTTCVSLLHHKVDCGNHWYKTQWKMKAESWNWKVLSKSSRWTLAFQKANQTIPDTLSGKELAALLTPALLNHACYPQSPPLHHSNSLQLQFMPFFPYSGSVREHKQLVSILSIITH